MKYLIITLLGIIPFFASAQDQDKSVLTGHVYLISYHQGGVELPPEEYMPRPNQTTIYVVQLKDSLSRPKVVETVESDVNGFFEIQLEPGLYGFVTKEDLGNLRKGQVLPDGYSDRGEYNATHSYWSTDVQLPLKIEAGEECSISITHTSTSICYMCP